jgi:Tol biopolymer transport system component
VKRDLVSGSCTVDLAVRAHRLLLVLFATAFVALIAGVDTTGTAPPIASRTLAPSAGDAFGLPARSALARRNGRIVYADPGPGGRGWWMFTVNADGRDKKLLTRDGGISPRWSPDGTKLLFTRGDNLFVMRAGPGAVPRFLIGPINGAAAGPAGRPELAAHWSPDGRRITFETVRGIEVANADGSGRRLLLRTRPRQLYFGNPDWSPDGGQIVLAGSQWAPLTWPAWVPEQIYVMRSNGTGLRQLTDDTTFQRGPSWSPDGRWILFARCPAPWAKSRVSELVLLKPDGSDQRTIARLPGTDCVRNITWSPDGRKILYLNERTGVEVMNVDGGARRRLLPWVLGVSGFSWQPLA